MACNSAACYGGCVGDGEFIHDDRKQLQLNQDGAGTSPVGACSDSSASGLSLCFKCKFHEPVSATHPEINCSRDIGRFCVNCFRGNLFGKFRLAVTANAMISPSDNVLVAFSGGASSRVVLQFVHEMQQKAQTNFDASRDRSLPVFRVGVAYIDDSAVVPASSNDYDGADNGMKLLVSSLSPPAKQFHVVPIGNVFSPDFPSGRDRLYELISVVDDVTGKEDLLRHLRMLSLQKFALENGYTKVVLGTCTSRIARHVLEATVKGQGFSLAADIQYVDVRWGIPVVLPLRDCLSAELHMVCSLDSLKTVERFAQPHAGINGLISSFVKLLQEENPSRESTIVRTAGKLTPFYFNRIPEVDNHNGQLASQRRQKKYNLKPGESLPPNDFCQICRSPLKTSCAATSHGFENGERNNRIFMAACSSCQFQILPKNPSSLEYFHALLPRSMASTAVDSNGNHNQLREQIQDYLLSDDEEGG